MRNVGLFGVVVSAIALATACGGGSNTIDAAVGDAPSADAAGPFSARVDFATNVGPDSVAIADLNGDGKPDLAIASAQSDIVSVLLNTAATGAMTPSFSARVDLPTGTGPRSVALSDINGDGKPDIVVANLGSGMSVLLNTTATGSTTANFSPKVDFAFGGNCDSIAIADLNGDGKPDVAVANLDLHSVSVLLNTTTMGAPTPTFSANADFTTAGSSAVAIADFNGDGKPDLAVSNGGQSRTVSILLNTTTTSATTPTFSVNVDFATATTTTTFLIVDSLAIGDLNGDGKPDLAVTNNNLTGTEFHSVSVLLDTTASGAATPSFSANVDFTSTCGTAPAPGSVAIGDLNRDGKPDVAFASAGGLPVLGGNVCGVSVLLNTTTGATTLSFSTRMDFATTTTVDPPSVATADLNGDGKLDLVVGGVDAVSVLLAG